MCALSNLATSPNPDRSGIASDKFLKSFSSTLADPQELSNTLVRWIKPRPADQAELIKEEPIVMFESDEVPALEQTLPGFSVRQALARMGEDLLLEVKGTSLASRFADIDQSVAILAYDHALSKLHEFLEQLQPS
ncbi:MAG: hypothetical protein FD135_1492 [Comamonadaceae bacterium]|nr:MAG: hypothetical protein FD135_1492 [Comamonadaceae bacterium]